MKHILLLLISLGILVSAFYYNQTQKTTFNKTIGIYDDLKRELKAVGDDLNFLKKNHKNLSFLTKKGWFVPQNRLIVGDRISQWAGHLNRVYFTIEPEIVKEISEHYLFKVSQILIRIDATLDNDIYNFIENILQDFPGLLVLRKLSISRNETINETNLLDLTQNKRPNFIVGEIIFEWFSMGEKKDEE